MKRNKENVKEVRKLHRINDLAMSFFQFMI